MAIKAKKPAKKPAKKAAKKVAKKPAKKVGKTRQEGKEGRRAADGRQAQAWRVHVE